MEYMKVSEAAIQWGISARRVRQLCTEGRIAGVIRKGNLYMIPVDAEQPSDARTKRVAQQPYSSLLEQIDQLKKRLSNRRPLTPAEVDALREMFIVEHTYNSNAIEGNTLTLQETGLVLQGITIDRKPLKDHLEAVGYKEAFEYVGMNEHVFAQVMKEEMQTNPTEEELELMDMLYQYQYNVIFRLQGEPSGEEMNCILGYEEFKR
jgi:hypothetical protein